jgi:hypothetical protein
MLAEAGKLESVVAQMGRKEFFVETKYDGERMQAHVDGNSFKYQNIKNNNNLKINNQLQVLQPNWGQCYDFVCKYVLPWRRVLSFGSCDRIPPGYRVGIGFFNIFANIGK